MKTSQELIAIVFEFLNENSKYAVLRNYHGLPYHNSSRDIDIIIEKQLFLEIESKIIQIVSECHFSIITLYKSEKLVTYICASTKNGIVDIIQFDFFFNTSLYGVLLLDAKNILDSCIFNGSVFHVSKEYEFLDKYLQLKFLNKPYPKKYKNLKKEIEQNELIPKLLGEVSSFSGIEALENISSNKFKRNVFIRNMKIKPLKQLLSFLLFLFYYIKNKITYKGFSIGFTGPDGAGKTTVIDEIIEGLGKVYSDIQFSHFRPTIIPNLGEVAHKTKLKSEVDLDYSNPHRGGQTSKINSFIRLLYYSIDYIIGYFLKTRSFLTRRSVVIFDRYFTDIIADSRRSRIFLNPKFLYWFGKLFIPKLDYNILLTANKDIILERKQELTAEGIDTINEKLNYLSNKKDYYLVFNEGVPDEAVHKILTTVFEKQHKKNMKRL